MDEWKCSDKDCHDSLHQKILDQMNLLKCAKTPWHRICKPFLKKNKYLATFIQQQINK